jgi:hypothetical protein
MALQNLLAYVGSHHLTIVEDLGLVAMVGLSAFVVLWCINDQRTKVEQKGK